MNTYLGVKGTDGKVLRDVTDSSGLPVSLTGSSVPDSQRLPFKMLSSTGQEPNIGTRGDNEAGFIGLQAHSNLMEYNGIGWDRRRNNTQGTLLASAARTASVSSPNQTNYNAKGIIAILDVTAVGASGGLTLYIQAIDPVTGKVVIALKSALITAIGTYGFELYPGSNTAGTVGTDYINLRVAGALPRIWLVRILHSDGTSYTYSVGYELIN